MKSLKFNPATFSHVSQSLPAIKGIAILIIVIYHLWVFTQGYSSFSQIIASLGKINFKSILKVSISLFCLMGQQGVHLFLVVSGFGLAASWWKKYGTSPEKSFSFKLIPFGQRRLMRILPLYWLAHGIAVALFLLNSEWVPYGAEIWQKGGLAWGAGLILSMTTLRNFFIEYYYFLNGAWWYVGLSIQLYLVFPILILFGKRFGWHLLLLNSLLISLVYRTLVIVLISDEKIIEILIRGAVFPSRLFEFVLGIVLAIYLLEQESCLKVTHSSLSWITPFLSRSRYMLLSAFFWVLGLIMTWISVDNGWPILRIPSDALLGIGQFFLIFQVLNRVNFGNSGLSFIGKYSYGTYLTHANLYVPLWALFVALIPWYLVRFVAVISLVFALGILFEKSFNLIEKNLITTKKATNTNSL